jgi:enhancer of polycomb-like protein
VEKLKRLRRELGEARNLLALVQKREVEKKSLLAKEKAIFEQRLQVKETKRKLGIRADDDDLLNEKVSPSASISRSWPLRLFH